MIFPYSFPFSARRCWTYKVVKEQIWTYFVHLAFGFVSNVLCKTRAGLQTSWARFVTFASRFCTNQEDCDEINRLHFEEYFLSKNKSWLIICCQKNVGLSIFGFKVWFWIQLLKPFGKSVSSVLNYWVQFSDHSLQRFHYAFSTQF